MWYVFMIRYPNIIVRKSSVGFPLYLTFFLLQLYILLIGGLLVRVKGNGASFPTYYSLQFHFAIVCVNHISSTKVRVRSYNLKFYIFLTVIEECLSTSVHLDYNLVQISMQVRQNICRIQYKYLNLYKFSLPMLELFPRFACLQRTRIMNNE